MRPPRCDRNCGCRGAGQNQAEPSDGSRRHRLCAGRVDRDGDNRQFARFAGSRQAVERQHLGSPRRAPGRPEIRGDDIAAKAAELGHAAIEGGIGVHGAGSSGRSKVNCPLAPRNIGGEAASDGPAPTRLTAASHPITRYLSLPIMRSERIDDEGHRATRLVRYGPPSAQVGGAEHPCQALGACGPLARAPALRGEGGAQDVEGIVHAL
jgi:hypothetical protein